MNDCGPHFWTPKGWRFWLCRHCYAPRSLHNYNGGRDQWVRSRPLNDNRYLSKNAPHFTEGW
jgi:hypothetical protein